VKCPQCGGAIAIPAFEPAGEGAASMAGLLDQEQVPVTAPAAKPTPAAAAVPKCPSCSAELTPGAVLCVNCGFDLRTGKQVEAGPSSEEGGGAKKKKKRRKKKREPGETSQGILFVRGLAVSFGCALLGSFLWFVMAYLTQTEWGFAAWVLGGLAGVGMMLGYGVEDVLAGLAAAAVAFVAIVVAKIMIFGAVLYGLEREFNEMANAEAGFEEMVDEGDSEVQEMGEEDEEEAADAEMGEGEIAAEELADGEGHDQEAADEEMSDEGSGDEDGELVEIKLPLSFWIWGGLVAMFGSFFDILFVLLACGTAYQVGSGGGWLE
jgi:hypothetical protein